MKDSRFIRNIVFSLLTVFLTGFFFSCVSSTLDVADDATSIEIIQLAQTSLDRGMKKRAISYYELLLRRYGMNTNLYIEARFEIAHIYMKQRRYEEAIPIYDEIIDLYNTSAPGQFPGVFRKLSEKDLEKAHDKMKNNKIKRLFVH